MRRGPNYSCRKLQLMSVKTRSHTDPMPMPMHKLPTVHAENSQLMGLKTQIHQAQALAKPRQVSGGPGLSLQEDDDAFAGGVTNNSRWRGDS